MKVSLQLIKISQNDNITQINKNPRQRDRISLLLTFGRFLSATKNTIRKSLEQISTIWFDNALHASVW